MNHSMRIPAQKIKKERAPESNAGVVGKVFIAAVIVVVLVGTFAFTMLYTGAPGQSPRTGIPPAQQESLKTPK